MLPQVHRYQRQFLDPPSLQVAPGIRGDWVPLQALAMVMTVPGLVELASLMAMVEPHTLQELIMGAPHH